MLRIVIGVATWMAAASAIAAPWDSTYVARSGPATLIRNATVLDGTGRRLDAADVLMRDGRIVAVGNGLDATGAMVVDAGGRWVTPGLIDVHSHLGVYPSPSVEAHQDGNEATDPVTAGVWAEHSVWPQDPGFQTALEGGVTTLQVLPGSANLIGGRGVTLRNVHTTTYQAMKFPGAPQGLKMACGENPKRVYGSQDRAPSTRMGNVAGYRQAFADAQDYRNQWNEYRAKLQEYQRGKGKDKDERPPVPPKRDLRLETLVAAMDGEVQVHVHCYRADEMAVMIDIAKEFGYKITAFHHASEAYKVADLLAKNGICSATWAGWWGFKVEALDGIEENAVLINKAGACVVIHSDDPNLTQRLNQETAAALAAGRRIGIDVPESEAIKWITANAAKMIGVADKTGTLETGKQADVVIWNADPFSVYATTEKVYIDGGLAYDRADPRYHPKSDFMLGHPKGGE